MLSTNRLLSLLSQLIGYNTTNPPGNELPCAEYLKDYLSKYGFETQLQISPDDPTRANVIASIGNKNGKTLVFNGHLDVVPVSAGWSSDPFKADIRDDKLYARGACDMKGGVAAMISGAIDLIESGFDFQNGQLILVFVYDEELHDMGVKHYIASPEFVKADFAVISEPSDMDLCIAHRGVVRYTLSILGKSSHAGVPYKGINAITNAGLAIQALQPLIAEVAGRTHEVLPAPTLTPTTISGGEKDNIVPNKVDIQIDRRTLPGETIESCQAEIAAVMDSLKKVNKDFDYRLEPYVHVDAGYVPAGSPIVEACASSFQTAFGKKIVIKDFSGCNDQNFFVAAGVPTVVFGPGSISVAHTVDEYVPLEDLTNAALFYKQLAQDILG